MSEENQGYDRNLDRCIALGGLFLVNDETGQVAKALKSPVKAPDGHTMYAIRVMSYNGGAPRIAVTTAFVAAKDVPALGRKAGDLAFGKVARFPVGLAPLVGKVAEALAAAQKARKAG